METTSLQPGDLVYRFRISNSNGSGMVSKKIPAVVVETEKTRPSLWTKIKVHEEGKPKPRWTLLELVEHRTRHV